MTNNMLRLSSMLALVVHCSALNMRSTNTTLRADGVQYGPVPHKSRSCEDGLEFDGYLYPCPLKPMERTKIATGSQFHHVSMGLQGSTYHKIKGFIPSWIALGLGGILLWFGKPGWQTFAATFILYFGAQTFLNFYMKSTLSGFRLNADYPDLKGMPAPFLVTAIQQFVSFVVINLAVFLSRFTPLGRSDIKLRFEKKSALKIIIMSISFTLNIGLNSLSLCVLDISVNLVIRAIGPIATAIVEQCKCYYNGQGFMDMTWKELSCLLIGTASAVVAVLAKTQDSSSESKNVVLGSVICVLSLFGSALELILAGVMQGSGDVMNAWEVIVNTSMPIVIFLILPIIFIPHPTAWPSSGLTTDLFVTKVIFSLNPTVFVLAVVSGFFAVCYNYVQYTLVKRFSAIQTAFASNANKAATIALSMILGFETFPSGRPGIILTFGIVVNLLAFCVYAIIRNQRSAKEKTQAMPEK